MSADDFGRLDEHGIESVAHRIDADAFWRAVAQLGEQRQALGEHTYEAMHRVEELSEQFAAFELLDIRLQDVVIVIEADDSPRPSLLAWRANATCRQEASGVVGVGSGSSATSGRLPDDHADKVVVQRPFGEAGDTLDHELVTEVARVLRPGGAATAFMPLNAAPTLQHDVLELAATAGLTVTVYLLVNVTELHPHATPRLGLVLRKPAGFTARTERDDDASAATWTPTANVAVAGPTDWQTLLPQGVVVVTAIAVSVMTFADLDVPLLRPLFAVLFLLTCPGLLLAHALRLPDRLAEVTLGVALSIAFNTIVVSALLLAGTSATQTILTVLLLLTFAALVIDLTFGGRVGAAKAP